MALQVNLWIAVSGGVSVSPLSTYYYNIVVKLPQTDASGNAAIYGTSYTPYFSDMSSCSNTMNLVNSPSINQPIFIDTITTTAVALGYLSDISFNIKFYLTRTNILSSS